MPAPDHPKDVAAVWRPGRWEIAALVLLYLLTFAARAPLLDAPPFVDETTDFYVAWTGGGALPNNYLEDQPHPTSESLTWFIAQRPAHVLWLSPAAQFDFELYRMWFVAVTSFLPVLVVGLLREHRVRASLAFGGAAAIAFNPRFVAWGAFSFPDFPMMMAIVGCLWALRRGREVLAGLLLLASVLLKEFAYLLVLAIFALSLLHSRFEEGKRLWPASLNRFQTIAAIAAIVGLWPLLLALSMGAPFPGGFHGGTWGEIFDRAFLSVWLIPFVVLGLAFPRTRSLSILALFLPSFFVGYRILGHSVAFQYFLPASLLALVAAALTLDETWTRARARWKGPRAWWVPVTVIALGLLQVVNAAAPHTMAVKAPLTSPVTGQPDGSLREIQDSRYPESVLYREAVDAVVSGGWRTVLELDGPYFNHFYPLPQHVDAYRSAHTRWADVDEGYLGRVVNIMENMTQVTVLRMGPGPANQALQLVYEDCVRFRNEYFLVIEGSACKGRWERVLEADASFRSGGSGR